jgi:hypothetical protein
VGRGVPDRSQQDRGVSGIRDIRSPGAEKTKSAGLLRSVQGTQGKQMINRRIMEPHSTSSI